MYRWYINGLSFEGDYHRRHSSCALLSCELAGFFRCKVKIHHVNRVKACLAQHDKRFEQGINRRETEIKEIFDKLTFLALTVLSWLLIKLNCFQQWNKE